MLSALSSKAEEKEIIVLDSLTFEAPKTKEMIKVLENVQAAKKALIVTAEKDENVVRSAANIDVYKRQMKDSARSCWRMQQQGQ